MPAWVPLVGHVVASVARNVVVTALVVGLALMMGFDPDAGALEWVAVGGLLSLFVLAITWMSVIFGLLARSVDAASGFAFIVIFLPYVSSAFVPTASMPRPLRAFADHQPVTPIIETARGLLTGSPIGSNGWLAVTWCLGLLAVAIPASLAAFRWRTCD